MSRNEVDHILFGAAYYDEYLMMKGIDRIDEDMKMMKDAGLNVIRIAESTWSTCEPQPGVFDFTYVDRALNAAQRAGIDVIVGFPGETEEDFRTTYDFLEGLKPAFLHIFPFSERPGTPAVDMPGKVQPSVATRRVAELEELCGRLHGAFCAKAVGSEDTVLFESTLRGGMMFGYTGSYRRVKAPYDRTRINAICRVRFGAMDESHDLMGDILD